MNEVTITVLMITAILVSWKCVSMWNPKESNTKHSDDNGEEKLKSISGGYFYCIQNREELPESDPILFGENLLHDSEERVAIYLEKDFPLALGGGYRDLARRAYAMDSRNFIHLSATLNERIRVLDAVGLTYPDVLQINYKIKLLRLQVDNESKRRNLICATNLFPERHRRATRLVHKDTPVYEREDPTWSEIKTMFSYTEDELLP